MRTILLLFLGLIAALPAIAQQPGFTVAPPAPQDGRPAESSSPPRESIATEEARRRDEAIERCKAARGSECNTDAGIKEFQDRPRGEPESPRSVDQAAPTATPPGN